MDNRLKRLHYIMLGRNEKPKETKRIPSNLKTLFNILFYSLA